MLRIIGESHREALRLLRTHRRALDALAAALMERETLRLEMAKLPLSGDGVDRTPEPQRAPHQRVRADERHKEFG